MTDSDRHTRSNATLLIVILIVGSVLLTSLVTPVAAHAYLSESDPANGEHVDPLPDELTLYFSGDGVVNADITLENPDGEVVSEESEIDPDDTQIVRVPIDDAAGDDGMYTVEWEVLADDGHTTAGSFFFAVGDEPLDRDAVLEAYEEDETDETIPAIEAGAKALLLVGVVGLLGIPAVAMLAVRPAFARADAAARSSVDERIGRLLAGAAGLTLVGAVVLGLTRSTALGPLSLETISQFVETPLGEAWIVQVTLAAVLAGLVTAAARGPLVKRAVHVVVFGGALAVAGTIAWTSHSATAIDQLEGAVVDFVHLLGAGLWAGGLVVLALVVVPVVRNAESDDRADLLARTIGRFSILAFVGVTLVVASGFVLASWHVPTADGLTGTIYGLTLVAKLVLAALALGLGGLSRFVLLPRLAADQGPETADGLRPASTDGGTERSSRDRSVSTVVRSIRLEVALLVVVVVLSGVLTSAPTAAVASGDDLVESTIEYEYDDHLVELSAFPATEETAGDALVLEADEPIVFKVAFLEDGGEAVASDQPVRLLASSDDGTEFEVELEETDDGTYAVVQPLADEGRWEFRITGAPDGSYVSEWIDAEVVPADEHDHDTHADADGGGHDDHAAGHDTHAKDHADHGGPEEATAFQTLLQFGAVVTVVGGVVAITLESLRLRGGRFDRE
ncbi:copper resistance CopC/CopD family protein [Natrialba swarupiae]|uniref:Copper resistance protein CopC n=1 Tax=Natrialba swarupiae TaxID=2448032 RepID=A0A5D5AJF4_9EURY|nr:FixH family protein [Natrialba swarupiae]TYT61073.1 copper resistance protein CopC [Natrialba swarupiae]